MTKDQIKLRILKEYFGHDSFRSGQEELIDSILSGRDVLGIMPTGAGKSMCYQIPALMSDGVEIVISPLISLMKDQVNSLIQSGIPAAYLNSSLTSQQYSLALSNAKRGDYKIIYVAPERLCTPSFLSFAETVRISIIAVDEAHCVSQWGQDFRPSYMQIPEFVQHLDYRPVIAAFTATATADVKDDISKMLKLDNPFTITTGFDRKNLKFEVMHPKNKFDAALEIIKRNEGKCGIVYCSTRKNVEEVCDRLNAHGFSCSRYHAGLSDEERRKNQDDFIFDRVQLITATNAFGMGIDKSNVSFVIHYNMPKNIESYYQEAGRAGRDGEPAECVLLYSGKDVKTNEFLINCSNENNDIDEETLEQLRKRDMERLKQMTFYSTTTGCLREFILGYFGEKAQVCCNNCSNCLTNFEEKDVTVEAQKILSCIFRLSQRNMRFGAAMIAMILRGSESEKIKRMGLTTLSTYGIMKDCPTDKIRKITSYLVELQAVRIEEEHSTLILTIKAKPVLMGEQKVLMKMPKEKKVQTVTVSDGIYSIDSRLMGKLKTLRLSLAKKANLPAYIIFSDSTLRDICKKMPRTSEQLLACSGIGNAKLQRYGTEILEVVSEFVNENPESIIKNRASYLLEKRQSNNSTDTTNMLYKLIRFNKSKITSSDEMLTLYAFCDRILDILCVAADRKILKNAIEQWLVQNSYITVNDKKTELTILSEEAGIMELQKISSEGKEYTTIVYTKNAQDFIIENIDEIFH